MDAAQIYALLKDLAEAVGDYHELPATSGALLPADALRVAEASATLERRWNHTADALARAANLRTGKMGTSIVPGSTATTATPAAFPQVTL